MTTIILLAILSQLFVSLFILRRLRTIEVTKEITIISKQKEAFTPVIIKPKSGVGNHIINELKHEQSGT